ncbi:MAG: UvrD-helicase domain-containing protein [bacterium]|jgi:DNA helicase-2/ATP-dependent DNA helicase PcrA|nr:UvrD-helicase domain-containing protein [bacterium]
MVKPQELVQKIETELNPPQKEAVLYTNGPLLVISGAGSGKTRVIAFRIAYLIAVVGLAPWNVLAVTFTNKAAKEMRERVEHLLGGGAKGLWIGTFHSICARMLRQDGQEAGIDPNFTIYDRPDQTSAIKRALDICGLSHEKKNANAYLNQISKAKSRFEWPMDYAQNAKSPKETQTANVYNEYTKILKENNALDFDDLLMQGVRLLMRCPEAGQKYRSRFQSILVDEYQDTNHPQYLFLRELATAHGNICAVGDDDQSIYRWRGASIRNILEFEQDYPNLKVVRLEQNYRSTGNIIGAAQALIEHNAQRHDKALWTKQEPGEKLGLIHLPDEQAEAGWICDEIERLHTHRQVSYRQFAVFYRVNAQSRLLEEECVRRGLPYTMVGALAFYQRKEIKDIRAYLQLLLNPADSVAFQRVVNEPKRKLGETSVSKLMNYAVREQLPILEAALHCVEDTERSGMRLLTCQTFSHFARLFEHWKAAGRERSLSALVERVARESGYWDLQEKDKDPQAQTRLENLQEFINAAAQFETELENQIGASLDALTKLEAFMENVSLVSDVDKWNGNDDRIVLMTLHGAKGLEFPYVFLTGMEDGLLPHQNSLQEKEQLEEERRLCYVGITRGMKKVYLTGADVRRLYNNSTYTIPSRFLQEIPAQFIEELSWDSKGLRASHVAMNFSHLSGPFQRDEPLEPGDLVIHRSFGQGVILEIEGQGNRAYITVDFMSVGKKTMVQQYAGLMKV